MSKYLSKQEVKNLIIARFWFKAFNGYRYVYVVDNPNGIVTYACKMQEQLFDISESLFLGEISSDRFLYDKNDEMWWTRKELIEWQESNCKTK